MSDPANFKMTFGSYRGSTLGNIYRIDRQYVMWLRDETDGPAQKAALEFIREENKRIIERGRVEARQ